MTKTQKFRTRKGCYSMCRKARGGLPCRLSPGFFFYTCHMQRQPPGDYYVPCSGRLQTPKPRRLVHRISRHRQDAGAGRYKRIYRHLLANMNRHNRIRRAQELDSHLRNSRYAKGGPASWHWRRRPERTTDTAFWYLRRRAKQNDGSSRGWFYEQKKTVPASITRGGIMNIF